MTARSPWTLESLERACRKVLLERSSLRLKALPMSRSADCEWVEPDGHAKMRVDPHEVGLRTGAVHELLHVVLNDTLSVFDESLAEQVVCAFEGLAHRTPGGRMRTKPTISVDEWLAELARLSARSDDGLTSMEWADKMGVSNSLALARLKEAQRAGWLRMGRRSTTSLDGKPTMTPVYQIIKPKTGTEVPKGGS
jgi:hypothetical protein